MSLPDPEARSAAASAATVALQALGRGEAGVADELFALVYDELREIARAQFRRAGPAATLQPTALVHEAYMKLVRHDVTPNGREHFFALAARVMRQALVDAARAKRADKRGGDWRRVSVELASPTDDGEGAAPTIEELDAALAALERDDERRARVVELRYFGGLSVVETARVLGVSERTVKSDWRYARAWLHAELSASRRE